MYFIKVFLFQYVVVKWTKFDPLMLFSINLAWSEIANKKIQTIVKSIRDFFFFFLLQYIVCNIDSENNISHGRNRVFISRKENQKYLLLAELIYRIYDKIKRCALRLYVCDNVIVIIYYYHWTVEVGNVLSGMVVWQTAILSSYFAHWPITFEWPI